MQKKKIHDEQNIQILNRDQSHADPYWNSRQEESYVPHTQVLYTF